MTTTLDAYYAHMNLAGARPKTIQCRQVVLGMLARFLDDGNLLAATRADLVMFLGRPLAPESRRCYRSHFKAFYAWCLDEELIAEDPTEKIPTIRVPRGTPRPISDSELTTLVRAADSRMRAWLLLMAYAGLRCLEVSRLQPMDVILEPLPMLYLRETKGGGSATVPLHPDVAQALAVLPIHHDGRWWRVQPATVSREVGDHMVDCGVVPGAHRLRHFCGTSWYRSSNHDLLATAALMRHANVATTQVYARLDPSRAAEIVASTPGLRAIDA